MSPTPGSASVSISQPTLPAVILNHIRRTIVEIRADWNAGDWEPIPYLTALSATQTVAPAISTATFRLDYGELTREDRQSFDVEAPLTDLVDKFVRILAVQEGTGGKGAKLEPIWVGYFSADAFDVHGDAAGTTKIRRGVQAITARGLEFLLYRTIITDALVTQTVFDIGAQTSEDKEFTIGRAPAFNGAESGGLPNLGNRTTSKLTIADPPAAGPFENHKFSLDGAVWNYLDVLNYLRGFFMNRVLSIPQKTKRLPEFGLSGQFQDLAQFNSVIDQEGKSVGQLLNELMDRRNGYGWMVRTGGEPDPVSQDPDAVFIHVFSTFGEDIRFEGFKFTANQEQIDWDFADQIEVDKAVVVENRQDAFDQVIVRGARILSCFSVSFKDQNLEKAWTLGEELNYRNGAGSDDDPSANIAARNTDTLDHVFTHFRLSPEWDWTAGDGEGELVLNALVGNANPAFDAAGRFIEDIEAPRPGFWNFDESFERSLPLADFPLGTGFRRPLIFAKDPDGKWHELHKPADLASFAATIRITDGDWGIRLSLQNGANETMARNHWSTILPKAKPGVFAVDEEPPWDWQDLIVTIAARTDQHLEVIVQITNTGDTDAPRIKLISDPTAEWWQILPQTVLVALNGGLEHFETEEVTGILRDDGDRLRSIAALARVWYGVSRAEVRVTLDYIALHAWPGSFIRDIAGSAHPTEVNTIVTQRQWDFVNRKTIISTGYVELNVVRAAKLRR